MNEFNYTDWMQQNKVGPYGKSPLKENDFTDELSEEVSISIPENTDYRELAKAVAKVLIEDYGQHNYKPFMQALIAELK